MLRTRTLAALCAMAALLAAPAAAQASFAPSSETLGGGPLFAVDDTAMSASGDTVVAWEDWDGDESHWVGVRFVSASGELGPPIVAFGPGGEAIRPVVALAPSGSAFIAWRTGFNYADVLGRWVGPDGSLGPVLTLEEGSEGGAVDPVELRATADSEGTVTVVWRNQKSAYDVGLRRISPSGEMSAVAEVPVPGTSREIGALPNGATAIVSRLTRAELVLVGPDLQVGPALELSPQAGAAPRLALDEAGRGFVVWREGLVEPLRLTGVRLAPDGTPIGPLLDIYDGLEGNPVDWNVSAAAGRFLVSWVIQSPGGDGTVRVRPVAADGALGPVSPPLGDGNASTAGTALFADGLAPIAWTDVTPDPFYNGFGRTIDAAGAPLSGIEPLGPGGLRFVESAPAAGAAAFIFEDFTGDEVHLRRYLVPPRCLDSSHQVGHGEATALPARCVGAGIEGYQVAEPPRHGTLAPAPGGFLYTPAGRYSGPDSFTYVAVNDGGASAPARASVEVAKPPPLRVLSLRLRHGRIAKSRPPRTTYRFELRLSERARATVRVEKPLRGVRRGRKCVKPRPGLTGKRCTRFGVVGKVRAKAPGKRLRLPIRGKLDRAISAGGRFRATAVANGAHGRRSAPLRRSFRFIAKQPNAKR